MALYSWGSDGKSVQEEMELVHTETNNLKTEMEPQLVEIE